MTRTYVVALHCSGGNGAQWRHLRQMLPSQQELWCPHFFGTSWAGHWRGEHAFTLADEAAPIISMIDALGVRVHLVGHSYGGAVALRVARERPAQIASMILYEPTAFHILRTAGPDGDSVLDEVNSFGAAVDSAVLTGDHRTAARKFVEYWSWPGAWATMRKEAQADVIHYMPKACLDFRALMFERTPLTVYRHFKFPALLLQGQQAREPMQVIGRQLAKALRLGLPQTVDNAGHMGPMTHASMVADLMAGFIKRHDDRDVVENGDAARYARAA